MSLVSNFSARARPTWPAVCFGQQFKVKPGIVLSSSTGINPQRAQEGHGGKSRENLISRLLFLPVYIFDLKES